jgi:predicted dehydrogenase
MAVYGTQGFAEVLGHQMTTFRLVPVGDGGHFSAGTPQVTETAGFNMLTAELEAFAASIAGGRSFPTPLKQIMHGVAVFEAVAESAAGKRPVTVRT